MPVWKKSMDLSVCIFKLTESLPKKEDYGLASALSVPGNIAEGFGRKYTKDKLNFYYDARGSLAETKNHGIYAQRVGYIQKKDHDDLATGIEDIGKELNKLIRSLANTVG